MAEERKKITPVVKDGSAKIRSDNALIKVAKKFVSNDLKGANTSIIDHVFVPKGVDMVVSVLKAIIDVIFYGTDSIGYSSSTDVDKVSYRGYWDENSAKQNRPKEDSSPKAGPVLRDPEVSSFEDAKKIIQAMNDLLERYPSASFNDLYDLAGIKNAPHTATKYGWTDFRAAKPVLLPNGHYIIKTPKAKPLD